MQTDPASQTAQIEGVQFKELKTLRDERGFFREAAKITDEFFGPKLGRLSHTRLAAGQETDRQMQPESLSWFYAPEGNVSLTLYDERPASPTHGVQSQVVIGENELAWVVRVPAGVAFSIQAQTDCNVVMIGE